MNRRSFILKSSTALGIGVASKVCEPVFSKMNRVYASTVNDKSSTKDTPSLEYRVLGKTGLKVSAVGYGAMRTTDPAVVHRALDLGINFIDTAHGYQDGNNEIMIGNVMKQRRDEAYVCTKIPHADKKRMTEMFETSLKRLQMDTVDILHYHSVKTIERLHNEEAMALLTKWKKQGKTRFIGFSTHTNEAELLGQAAKDKFWDVILVAYNFKKSPELTKAIEAVAKAGIGVVAMKTQAGGYKDSQMGSWSPHQAALKWVLQNPHVHAAIPSMTTFEELEEDVQVMGKKMGWHDRKVLDRYGQIIDPLYCRACNSCVLTCPHGVDIPEINRCLMYAEGYGDLALARMNYAELSTDQNVSHCIGCEKCVAKCVHGLNIARKMETAHRMFS